MSGRFFASVQRTIFGPPPRTLENIKGGGGMMKSKIEYWNQMNVFSLMFTT